MYQTTKGKREMKRLMNVVVAGLILWSSQVWAKNAIVPTARGAVAET